MRIRRNSNPSLPILQLLVLVTDTPYGRSKHQEWTAKGAVQPEFYGPSIILNMKKLLAEGHRYFVTWHPATARYLQYLINKDVLPPENIEIYTPDDKVHGSGTQAAYLKRIRLDTKEFLGSFMDNWPYGYFAEEDNLALGYYDNSLIGMPNIKFGEAPPTIPEEITIDEKLKLSPNREFVSTLSSLIKNPRRK